MCRPNEKHAMKSFIYLYRLLSLSGLKALSRSLTVFVSPCIQNNAYCFGSHICAIVLCRIIYFAICYLHYAILQCMQLGIAFNQFNNIFQCIMQRAIVHVQHCNCGFTNTEISDSFGFFVGFSVFSVFQIPTSYIGVGFSKYPISVRFFGIPTHD